jgi:hypothetical protein
LGKETSAAPHPAQIYLDQAVAGRVQQVLPVRQRQVVLVHHYTHRFYNQLASGLMSAVPIILQPGVAVVGDQVLVLA